MPNPRAPSSFCQTIISLSYVIYFCLFFSVWIFSAVYQYVQLSINMSNCLSVIFYPFCPSCHNIVLICQQSVFPKCQYIVVINPIVICQSVIPFDSNPLVCQLTCHFVTLSIYKYFSLFFMSYYQTV